MNLIFPVQGDNYGGVDRFWFAHEDDIAGVDANGQIILKPGKQWSIGKAVKYSMEFQNQPSNTRGGIVFSPVLTGVIKKYRPDLDQVVSQMLGEKFAIIFKDLNGFLIQVGLPGELLTFSAERNTGALPYENNQYKISFRGEGKKNTVVNRSISINQ